MAQVLETAERLWSGKASTRDMSPVTAFLGLEQVADGLAFLSSFGNVIVLDTSAGLVLFDTGSFFLAQNNYAHIRDWSTRKVHTAVYTHGHVDHAFGLPPFEAETGAKIEVIAHPGVRARFERYQLTSGYNESINRRQFGMPVAWPTQYRFPDRTVSDRLNITVGGEKIELRHAKGETDDHVWIWMPERRMLCTGDLFIWASPNCGNPQKVQRFPREWAAALREMAALAPDMLLPGHGLPIIGRDRTVQALSETAELLETLVEQTLELMNAGANLDRVLHEVQAPARLLERPYLRPVYDEPEFIVRNLWRLYGGWYDGNPAHLKPAPDAALAKEIAALASVDGLVARGIALSEAGEHRLACHLVELAFLADSSSETVTDARALVYSRRAETETSLMAKGVFTAAAEGR